MPIVRFFSLLGFGISLWLVVMKATGKISSVVGCGAEGGCADVLGSQWSQWFGIPVSAVSTAFYIALFGLTFRTKAPLFSVAGWILLWAAGWFMGLQVFVIEAFCPWCFATHMVGLMTAVAIFWKVGIGRKKVVTGLASFGLIALLALGQTFGPKPETFELTDESDIEEKEEVKAQVSGEGRVIQFRGPNGQVVKTYRLGSVPLLGPPDAPHVLVKYFDYTCKSCREMEGDLLALMTAYPKEVAVIVLPTPLNRACNPYLNPRVDDHANACEFARMSLAVWRTAPESFPKVHKLLFERPLHSVESARKAIGDIIGTDKLEAGLKDPGVEKLLQASIADFRQLSSQRIEMPKLLMKGARTMHGLASSTEKFIELVVKTMGIK
ncbi:MAG: vitamin K epoxide reductase family protein [Akkermansiaceae bacterium]